jgi:hypothetical protein
VHNCVSDCEMGVVFTYKRKLGKSGLCAHGILQLPAGSFSHLQLASESKLSVPTIVVMFDRVNSHAVSLNYVRPKVSQVQMQKRESSP